MVFDLRNQAKPWKVLKEIRVKEKNCKSPSVGFELAIPRTIGRRSTYVPTESLDNSRVKFAII